jgi:hypothetical protein
MRWHRKIGFRDAVTGCRFGSKVAVQGRFLILLEPALKETSRELLLCETVYG